VRKWRDICQVPVKRGLNPAWAYTPPAFKNVFSLWMPNFMVLKRGEEGRDARAMPKITER